MRSFIAALSILALISVFIAADRVLVAERAGVVAALIETLPDAPEDGASSDAADAIDAARDAWTESLPYLELTVREDELTDVERLLYELELRYADGDGTGFRSTKRSLLNALRNIMDAGGITFNKLI